MRITAWRIVKGRFAAQAFDGEGARVEGGRWNLPGTPVVYTSESVALAALEMLVHLGRGSILGAYVTIPCEFDERVVARVNQQALPRSWRSYPTPPALQAIGDEWVKAGSSAVLQVPSAVVPNESNYLLNPRHPDFRRIDVLDPKPFEFDLRLLGSRSTPGKPT